MNQEIAVLQRWGRPEILDRAARLAERAVSLWPGPVRLERPKPESGRWKLLDQALTELPVGAWTTYGDVAALIGSHPVAVGDRLANHPVPNAHRVLRADGTLSPNFRWLDPATAIDPMDLLREEGVTFDEHGRANPNQRMTTAELAHLLAVDVEESARASSTDEGHREEKFFAQLGEFQGPTIADGVRDLIREWAELGGHLDFGFGDETSCFLMSTNGDGSRPAIWPLTIYPSGRCEVVFQHLARRPPFDDPALREQLRQRLSTVAGVDLPAAKIELRPSFPLQVLALQAAREALVEQLRWFRAVVSA
ncbi:MGMT family protein [Pseudonocardia sp. H11422]|uniref:MGMT family protein n=1 Tax=Pseudonocardia sp. H11422 TaxID=2835866 RepID=UPI001BDC5697|nr:MGMT family protein [Pseudonocardia sp. H11422]